jgi:protein-S-isoprenylcysteine O-methyltransferase Ste14
MSQWVDFLYVFFALLVYGVLHSLLASFPAKAAARRLFGPVADRVYRLAFNTVAMVTFIPVLVILGLHAGPVIVRLSMPIAAFALAGQGIAFILFVLAVFQTRPASFFGLRQLGVETADSGLLTSGAYAIVRHPLYSLALILLWLFPIMTTGSLAFNLGSTLYILIGSELEERRLMVEFGEEYRRYRSRVARLIPFLF